MLVQFNFCGFRILFYFNNLCPWSARFTFASHWNNHLPAIKLSELIFPTALPLCQSFLKYSSLSSRDSTIGINLPVFQLFFKFKFLFARDFMVGIKLPALDLPTIKRSEKICPPVFYPFANHFKKKSSLSSQIETLGMPVCQLYFKFKLSFSPWLNGGNKSTCPWSARLPIIFKSWIYLSTGD